MAFVFRSSRNCVDSSPQNYQKKQDNIPQVSNHGGNQSKQQTNKQGKKSPIKGLAYQNLHNYLGIDVLNDQNGERSASLKAEIEKFDHRIKGTSANSKENRYTKIKTMNSQSDVNPDNQYVFKSKIKRSPFSKLPENHEKILKTQQYPRCGKKENIIECMNSKRSAASKNQNYPACFQKNAPENINLLLAKKKQTKVSYIPSIPNKFQQYGYVLKEQSLSYPKLINRGRFDGEKNDFPGPCEYNTDPKRSVKNVLKFKPQQMSKINKFDDSFIGTSEALVHNQQILNIHNEKIKQWIQQGKDSRKNIQINSNKNEKQLRFRKIKNKQMNNENDSEDQSEGQYEYEFDTTPGPGYYSYDPLKKKNFRSIKSNYQKIFYSMGERFKNLNKDESNYWEQQELKTSKETKQKIKFFASKLPRECSLYTNSAAPPPGYYDPRNSMLDQIMARMLRNSTKLINNNIPKIQRMVQTDSPGPGSYCLDPPNFKVQSFIGQSDISNINTVYSALNPDNSGQFSLISMENAENILVEKASPKNHARIHERPHEEIPKKVHAPFMSLSPNKLNLQTKQQYSPNLKKERLLRLQQQRKETIKQNKYPFNSTQINRNNSIKDEVNAGVGLYELANPNIWNKKSFNMYFH